MTSLGKYDHLFLTAFRVKPEDPPGLKYRDIPLWDSPGHMDLIGDMEGAFKISIGIIDVLDLSSYEKGREILTKYDVELRAVLRLERWTEPLTKSNCYLLGEAGRAVVIDPNDPRGPLEWLEMLGWTPEQVLLTHEHCNHMAGLEALRGRWLGVRVAATAVCSAGLGDTRPSITRGMEIYLTLRGKPRVSYPPFVYRPAGEAYEHAWEYVWQEYRPRIMALPGRTPESTGIFLDENAFFSESYLIPEEKIILRLPGGSEVDYRAVTEPILQKLPPDLRICPDHGEPYILAEKE